MKDHRRSCSEDLIRAAFARFLKSVRFCFVTGYRLTDAEADEGAEILYDWFHRLYHRPGTSNRPPASLADSFMMMISACRLAQELQLWKLDGAPCEDTDLAAILARDPRQVAVELFNKLIESQR